VIDNGSSDRLIIQAIGACAITGWSFLISLGFF